MPNPEGAASDTIVVGAELAGFEVQAADAPVEGEASKALKVPFIIIDSASFDASNLTDWVRTVVTSLQFFDARLMVLYNKLRIFEVEYFSCCDKIKPDLLCNTR